MRRKPRRKGLIKKLDLCTSTGGSKITSFDDFLCQTTNKILTEIEVSKGSSKMEQRCLKWTTYQSIMKWFDMLKEQLRTLGFAQLATDYDKACGVTGEIAPIEEQAHHILNLDENEVSWDETSNDSGG